jgi:hypothetical protein
MPSVWLTPRKTKKGRVWLVRWQTCVNGVRRWGAKSCGPFKAFAEEFAQKKKE